MTAVGFIGLGAMGWPMAARLAGAGHELVVLDASADRAHAFADEYGATAAASAAELARGAEVVITMLPASAIVEQVMAGPDGGLAGLAPGATIIEMSSGEPGATRRLLAAVEAAGGHLLDAPVSGGVPRARSGDLAIMVGGPADQVALVEPLLALMGTSIMRTGEVGTAHAMKALNNLVSAAGLLVAVEAMLIGQRFGLEAGTIVDILNVSTGMNNSTRNKLRQFVLSRRFDAGFGLDLMVKDLTIAVDLARDVGVPAPLSAQCRELWASAQAMLGPGRDHTEVARLCEALAGFELDEHENAA